jgi:hypothetical protein
MRSHRVATDRLKVQLLESGATFIPQPMDTQAGTVLKRCAGRGGTVRTERFEGPGHSPPLDAREGFTAVSSGFLGEVAGA